MDTGAGWVFSDGPCSCRVTLDGIYLGECSIDLFRDGEHTVAEIDTRLDPESLVGFILSRWEPRKEDSTELDRWDI